MSSPQRTDRDAALAKLDIGAISDSLTAISPAVWTLAPWAAAVLLRRSLEKLTKPASGSAAASPATIAAELQQSGIGARLEALASSPERIAQLGAIMRTATMVVPPRLRPLPEIPGIQGRVRKPEEVLSKLAGISARFAGQEAAFTSLAQLGTIMSALRLQSRVGSVAAPPLSAVSLPTNGSMQMAWPAWGMSLTTLGGTLSSLGFHGGRNDTAPFSPALLAQRLDVLATGAAAAPPPVQVTLPPDGIKGLAAMVSALTTMDLARRQLSVDLLAPGWRDTMSRVASSAAGASARVAAAGTSAPSAAELEQLSALRSTLAGINRLEAIGLQLRSPGAAQRLDAAMRPLDRAASNPAIAGAVTGAANDAALQHRLLNEFLVLYGSLMVPLVRRQAGRTGRKK